MKRVLILLTGLLLSISVLHAQNPGDLDLTFNGDVLNGGEGANNWVRTIALQPDGKVLIGGEFTSYNGTTRNRIARLNANGSLDTSFNPGQGANNTVNSIAIQVDGKILIGGQFSFYNGTSRNSIARINADGSLDPSFNPGIGVMFDRSVNAIVLQPDGKILMGGDFYAFNNIGISGLARLNGDGSLDPSFNFFGVDRYSDRVSTIALRPNGGIFLGGYLSTFRNNSAGGIVSVNPDGSPPFHFLPGFGYGSVTYTIALQPDGKLLVGGDFYPIYDGKAIPRITRMNGSGDRDPTFNSDPNIGAVLTIALQPDGRILIGGDFTSIYGTTRNRIARLDADGSLDTSFTPGTGANNTVLTTALQPDGKILIGGNFTEYNGVSRGRIARLYGDIVSEEDTEKPIPTTETLPDLHFQCEVLFDQLDIPTANDNVDGTILGTTDQSIFPITLQGSITITWTYTDETGNTSSQTQNIMVEDTEEPEVLVKNYNLQLDNTGNGILMVDDIDKGSFDNCTIETRVLSQTTFTCANEGNNEVILTVTDAVGNSASAKATVTVLEPITPITVNINSTVAPNENNNVVIFPGAPSLGLPSSTTLSASGIPSAYIGLTYQWYWRNTPSGSFQSSPISNSPSIVVNASGDFAREYKLMVYSNSGCIAEKTISVISVEASCGKGNKVAVCHVTPSGKRKTICVSKNAVKALLAGSPGSFVGNCSMNYRLEGAPEIITVPWNTSLEVIYEKIVAQNDGWFDSKQVNLSLSADSYNALASGLYELKADLVENESFTLEESVSIKVLVLDKPQALDILISNDRLAKDVRTGQVIGTLSTIDPADDIHTYSIDAQPDLHIEGNQLIWKGNNVPTSQMKITVFSTDRAGHTISKEIVLSQEIGSNQFILYPNPAYNQTNVMIDLHQRSEIEIKVFDAVGRMVIEDIIYCEEPFIQTLHLTGLASGMYVVQVKVGNIITTERLIKR